MKPAPFAALFLLLAYGSSVFGHGVERGALKTEIFDYELAFLSDRTKAAISQLVEERCDLTGMVSATAEIADEDRLTPDLLPPGFRIRLSLVMEKQASPVIIIVEATRLGLGAADGELMEYFVKSPVCH